MFWHSSRMCAHGMLGAVTAHPQHVCCIHTARPKHLYCILYVCVECIKRLHVQSNSVINYIQPQLLLSHFMIIRDSQKEGLQGHQGQKKGDATWATRSQSNTIIIIWACWARGAKSLSAHLQNLIQVTQPFHPDAEETQDHCHQMQLSLCGDHVHSWGAPMVLLCHSRSYCTATATLRCSYQVHVRMLSHNTHFVHAQVRAIAQRTMPWIPGRPYSVFSGDASKILLRSRRPYCMHLSILHFSWMPL